MILGSKAIVCSFLCPSQIMSLWFEDWAESRRLLHFSFGFSRDSVWCSVSETTNQTLFSLCSKPVGKQIQEYDWGLPWWLRGKELTCQRQETRARSLVREDPVCLRAAEPTHHAPWACASEQEKALQWEACTLQPESSSLWPKIEVYTAAKTQRSQI